MILSLSYLDFIYPTLDVYPVHIDKYMYIA